MSGLWWLQPGWTDATCMSCGSTIWPEGDPDWGKCFSCFSHELAENEEREREIHNRLMQQYEEQHDTPRTGQ